MNSVNNISKETIKRLNDKISLLRDRSALGLIVGSITSAVTLLILWLFISSTNKLLSPSSDPQVIYTIADNHFFLLIILPRISAVVILELVALAFFNIAYTSFHQIKYFHNEITNIEMKSMAIEASQIEKVPIELLEELIKTERNYILRKGETTVDIEKAKIQYATESNFRGDPLGA
jgi:hypothetical protein